MPPCRYSDKGSDDIVRELKHLSNSLDKLNNDVLQPLLEKALREDRVPLKTHTLIVAAVIAGLAGEHMLRLLLKI